MNTGEVDGIARGVGTAPDVLHVATGGRDGTPNVTCTFPVQIGDIVGVESFHNQWYVVVNFSRKAYPVDVIPSMLFGNTAPSGALQLATLYDIGTPGGAPALFGVYSAPVVGGGGGTGGGGTGGTVPVAPTFSRTYDNVNHWDLRNDEVRQGAPADYTPITSSTGCYFYPSIAAALGSSTPSSVSIHLIRDSDGGNGGPVPLHVALHAATDGSGGSPPIVTSTLDGLSLARDGSADLALPADWLAMLLAGTATGVCVTSSSRADYLILRGASGASGNLTFTV